MTINEYDELNSLKVDEDSIDGILIDALPSLLRLLSTTYSPIHVIVLLKDTTASCKIISTLISLSAVGSSDEVNQLIFNGCLELIIRILGSTVTSARSE